MSLSRKVLLGCIAAIVVAAGAIAGDRALLFRATFIGSGSNAAERSGMEKLRDVVAVSDYSGSDVGVQIVNAVAALPSTGGVVDGRMLQGDLTINSGTLTLGTSTKPITLLLGPVRIHNASDPAIAVAGASCIIGATRGGTQNGGTQIIFDGVNNNGINWTGSFGCLKDLELVQGPSGNNGLTLIASGTTNVTHNVFENLRLEGGNSSVGSVGVRLISATPTALVYGNTFVNLRVLEYDRNIQFETSSTNGSTTNWFFGTFLGSTTGLGTAGINIISGDTNQFDGLFVQAKAVGIQVGSAAKYNSFSNARLESNTTNVSNAGTGTQFMALSLDTNTVTDTGTSTILNGNGNVTYTQKAPSLTIDQGLIVGQGAAGNPRLQVQRVIQPVQPSPNAPTSFPLGNDLYMSVSGPADIHLANLQLDLTATTNASIGANASIVISTTTSGLCPPAGGCSILIEPASTSNYELIGSANWSVVDATHISFTATKAHTQPYTVRQHGGTFFDTGQLVRFNLSSPQSYVSVRNSANSNDGFKISEDSAGNQQIENNGRVAIGTTVSASASLFIRPTGLSSSTTQYGIQSAQVSSSGATSQGFGVIARSDTPNTAFTQTNNACFYAQNPTKGAASTITNAYGLFVEDITNGGTLNRAIFTQGAAVSEFSGGIIPGTTTQGSLGTPANGRVIYCSDCTIANPCAGGGTGALAKRLNGVWVCN